MLCIGEISLKADLARLAEQGEAGHFLIKGKQKMNGRIPS
jgi:hypothetical protein